MKYPLLAGLALAVLSLSGCVTHITTEVTMNPPPAEKFSDFNRFELRMVELPTAYAHSEGNQKALVKIQQNLSKDLDPVLAQWNDEGKRKDQSPRTLVIEPVIREIKFLNATVRVWTGSLSGSSAVILDARCTERESGKVIATPMFYAKASAMGGAWTFGVTDNLMLARIADRLSDYVQRNYAEAVGGPTGAEPEHR